MVKFICLTCDNNGNLCDYNKCLVPIWSACKSRKLLPFIVKSLVFIIFTVTLTRIGVLISVKMDQPFGFLSEKKLIYDIQKGGKKKDRAIEALYKKNFPLVARWILKHGGSDEDAKDIFQDAIVIFYEKLMKGEYTHQAKISTYLLAVARNQWLKKLRDTKRREQKLEDWQHSEARETEEMEIELMIVRDRLFILQTLMDKLSEDCRKVLALAVYQNKSMQFISEQMGYKNPQIARNKKNRCLNALRKFAQNFNQEYYPSISNHE